MYVVYKHTNTLSNKCYVGKTKHGIDKRWEGHVVAALRGSMLHLHAAIRKYPLDSWKHEILESIETNEAANLCETRWITDLRSNDPQLGYNMTPGGDGGPTCTPEQMSVKMKGVPKTPEHRRHMRESQERYWDSAPETDTRRQKLAERNASEEGAQKSREAQNRRWAKPGAREAMRALWQDPEWRTKTLEARRQAKIKQSA